MSLMAGGRCDHDHLSSLSCSLLMTHIIITINIVCILTTTDDNCNCSILLLTLHVEVFYSDRKSSQKQIFQNMKFIKAFPPDSLCSHLHVDRMRVTKLSFNKQLLLRWLWQSAWGWWRWVIEGDCNYIWISLLWLSRVITGRVLWWSVVIVILLLHCIHWFCLLQLLLT